MPASGGEHVTHAVIDIGSNSVRLVVYRGPERLPWPVLNEKVPAALGRTLAEDGLIPPKAMDMAIAGLARFARLVELLGVPSVRVVATAAARDAKNGAEFLARTRALGLEPELLTGEQEAAGSAMGIASAFPHADGIVGDLGGGSLELVELADAVPGRGESFQVGTLRLPRLRAGGPERFERAIDAMLDRGEWSGAAAGRTFYCVGGSWRALAHVDMNVLGTPLYDPQAHAITPARLAELARIVAELPAKKLREVPGVSAIRAASLADATALLERVVRRLKPERIVFSSFGLREGLLFQALDPAVRRLDPLTAAARDLAARNDGDPALGDAMAQWIAPLFAADPPEDATIRHAACLLATIGSQTERKYRARRGVEIALDERWAGIDPRGRALLGRALHGATGEKGEVAGLERLAPLTDLARAAAWGLALRFAIRFSGACAAVIERSALRTEGDRLLLEVPADLAALYSEPSEQAHQALAAALSLRPELGRVRNN